ncbi:MAG: bifunctional methylenetetrahydrofolate dehydrogenase/methenyltetrahydrofolate cyclohydrolase FolD [Chlamydiae bacterium]|jgi:methylenetetrahydrofolate dehydrogenase (NADP+)/methenyltetrahydrofolate cyclohydrolase|nr:bifunctional methylenetetrahydrofolate dehydrogenase/methenyltetrahydrofolate cyclohydrolase FolD [Chlamydiota bacterium]
MDISGKELAKQFQEKLKEKISREKHSITLAFVLVGKDPPSQAYVRMKERACSEVGIKSLKIELPDETTEFELLELIGNLNSDPSINGILVQMPLPSQINEEKVLLTIDPDKDVDGFHPFNVGKMITGDKHAIIPCTPLGVLKLLEAYQIETKGKHVVVIGRSNIVGRPLANLLSQKRAYGNATVTLVHSHSKDLSNICKQADILIAAIGKPLFVTKEMVKPGAVVIDVGINRVNDKIVGDVNYSDVKEIVSFITPVPGGVGPMTIAMLLENTYLLAKEQNCSLS